MSIMWNLAVNFNQTSFIIFKGYSFKYLNQTSSLVGRYNKIYKQSSTVVSHLSLEKLNETSWKLTSESVIRISGKKINWGACVQWKNNFSGSLRWRQPFQQENNSCRIHCQNKPGVVTADVELLLLWFLTKLKGEPIHQVQLVFTCQIPHTFIYTYMSHTVNYVYNITGIFTSY